MPGRSSKGRLTAVEFDLLDSMSGAVAHALQKARMRESEEKLQQQMKAIRQAILSIDIGGGPNSFLKELVARACELTQARYGALGVLNAEGTGLADFITVGVAEGMRKLIGHLPEGKGLLGAVIRERRAVRVARISDDARSCGFPQHHPQMTTFLGIPLRVGHTVFGNFYVTDKALGREFTEEDERTLEIFGTYAALAVDYARRVEEAEERRKKQFEGFRELERLRNSAIAIASHDLKNPIQAILMQSQILREQLREGQPANPDVLARIERSARGIAVLAEDLLDATTIEAGKLQIAPKPLDLAEAIPALIENLAPTLGPHRFEVQVKARPLRISVDPGVWTGFSPIC